ncbi:FMN-binding negative transcriptional regulator [Marinimicrobium sp. ABcell2]|uniref:FMN-binding negative transcriptional regulator n=1 Tax=Marinimicrobium sp. ABcell2 TaxID=3069751 RepID=UPI0027B092B1|nr:FMN-binding negative transcriptional regulator [Marinimicrobium sp. ABcell2]MDQ2078408.1 FMN-binding negative transcriptional regulator [Marinimicrobium sp. ABcell2]
MYIPKHFKEDDTQTLHQYIRDYSFGLLVVADANGIEANHVPFHLNTEESGTLGRLQCHVARSNPVWQRLGEGTKVLVVFQGPDAYVSPSWYPTKKETDRVVPTWNYLAIHAEGIAKTIEDSAWLLRQLHALTDQHESAMSEPWSVDDAPAEFTDRLLNAIVGVEIEITALKGKLKASQNQPARNKAGVKAGLAEVEGKAGHAMSEFIKLEPGV